MRLKNNHLGKTVCVEKETKINLANANPQSSNTQRVQARHLPETAANGWLLGDISKYVFGY